MEDIIGSSAEQMLTQHERSIYRWLGSCAAQTAGLLHAAWQRPFRHNKVIERAALWNVIRVEGWCDTMLHQAPYQHLMRPKASDAATRYEFEAAIRTIPELLPFQPNERKALHRASTRKYDSEFGIEDVEDGVPGIGRLYPELTNRWHRWIWSPEPHRASQPDTPSLESEIMAQACTHLARSIGAILEPL
jgi:hypothetical protein